MPANETVGVRAKNRQWARRHSNAVEKRHDSDPGPENRGEAVDERSNLRPSPSRHERSHSVDDDHVDQFRLG